MKPIYLEFCGLNSFEDKAHIDFAKLLSGGVFGIFGDTGSGKSTILDSIHFALYGEIDRAPKSFNDCINYHSDGAYVTFDFEISTEGVRHVYRVKRERRRKNGTTKAYLYERLANGELLALAEGTRDVDEKIEQIIGLTFSDFKMCIALPQGDFSALVKSTQAERVKLVARLFNLEKYGERLTKAVNEKYFSAEEEVNLIRAKMEENEASDEAGFEILQAELVQERAVVKEANEALINAETALQKWTALQREKEAFDALCRRLEGLQERLKSMQELREKLEKFPKAQAIKERIEERENAKMQRAHAWERAKRAHESYDVAVIKQQKAKAYAEGSRFDEKILALSLQMQKVRDGAQDTAHAERIQKEYDACVAQYRALKDKCVFEDFAGKKLEIEGKLSALGEDANLLDYLKHNYKGVILADTYGEVRADLTALAQKHPSVSPDIQPLLEKYTLQTDRGETLDILSVNLAFREQEQQRKRLQTELEALETRRQKYERNEDEKKLIEKQGTLLKQNLLLAKEKIADLQGLGTEQELALQIESLKKAQADSQIALEKAQADCNAFFAEKQTQEQLASTHAERANAIDTALQTQIKENGFADEAQALSLVESVGEYARNQKICTAFFEDYELCRRQYEETDKTRFDGYSDEEVVRAKQTWLALKERKEELVRSLNFKEAKLERLLALREKYKEQGKLLAEKQKRLQTCDELRLLLRGNKFLEFIACEYLQEICLLASKTLLSLTGGRYFLQYDKEFKIGDNLNGGELRTVKTLSGGETFLVSLSLALSLSASICQKSARPIEFFFLDEGFGTLDEKLVETVMDVLGKLSKTFSVGLISHVEELKRRIENKILVTGANERHGSYLSVETLA